MIVVKVNKRTKNTSNARVLNSEALYRLKDYPDDDDDMEFITHKPIDVDLELAPPEGDARKPESSIARGSKKSSRYYFARSSSGSEGDHLGKHWCRSHHLIWRPF